LAFPSRRRFPVARLKDDSFIDSETIAKLSAKAMERPATHRPQLRAGTGAPNPRPNPGSAGHPGSPHWRRAAYPAFTPM
jgi:hypothetical protein